MDLKYPKYKPVIQMNNPVRMKEQKQLGASMFMCKSSISIQNSGFAHAQNSPGLRC